ncbi:necdin-like 2 isoform X2 [Gouania willdenowi]|uniref:Non-structural maintenance of chromosomes element 3 homolog n=1 Tax=Gouania willdenowi TaxID=441366 RepID=A0A8C5NDP0_GOUWI|nr:non-structural maintenance of chromosomes element 3 homolog isoform X2 [Gouania willdenowi]
MSQRKRVSTSQSSSQNKRPASLSLTATNDDDDSMFTLPSTSQVLKGLENLTEEQVYQKTAEVLQYFLVRDQKKIPIRRADIMKHVVKDYRNIYPEIIKRTARTLDQVFGLKLVEIDTKNHTYILINKLEEPEGMTSSSGPANLKSGLLFVVLGLIFMKGGFVRENLIWNLLKKLHVDIGQKHNDFGDVKKLITEEFVRQRYLEYVKIPHTEPVEHEFCWGQRADVEVSKVKILELMAQLHKDRPESWSQQYKEAHSALSTSSQATSSSQR